MVASFAANRSESIFDTQLKCRRCWLLLYSRWIRLLGLFLCSHFNEIIYIHVNILHNYYTFYISSLLNQDQLAENVGYHRADLLLFLSFCQTKHIYNMFPYIYIWEYRKAKSELWKGARRDRRELLTAPRLKKPKKLAWVTTLRLPSKSEIIIRNLHLLHADPQNKEFFPKNLIISADRRRKNLAQMYKQTVPRRFVTHGPENKPGFNKCLSNRCDACKHGCFGDSFQPLWYLQAWVFWGFLPTVVMPASMGVLGIPSGQHGAADFGALSSI